MTQAEQSAAKRRAEEAVRQARAAWARMAVAQDATRSGITTGELLLIAAAAIPTTVLLSHLAVRLSGA